MITRMLAPRGTHAACWLRGDAVFVAWQDGEWLVRRRMAATLPEIDTLDVLSSLSLTGLVGAVAWCTASSCCRVRRPTSRMASTPVWA